METIKDILKFCNNAILYNYKNIGITVELNQVRKCMINSFHKTIPDSRIRVSLSMIDDMILKINSNDSENIIEYVHDLGENILYILSFEKLIRDKQSNLNDDEQKTLQRKQII